MRKLSIIVPVHRPSAEFTRCLKSLLAADRTAAEIMIVVDSDSDRVIRNLVDGRAKVACTQSCRGPAAARNLGAELTQSEALFFIDSDIEVPPGLFRDAIQLLEMHPKIDAFIGSYDDQPGAADFYSQYKNLVHHITHQAANEDAFTFWGACGLIRRQAFEHVGGFDEHYRYPSIEDIEIGYRLRAADRKMRLCKEFQVKHLKRWTLKSIIHTDLFRRATPWSELIFRHRRLANDLNLSKQNRFKVAMAGLLLFCLAATIVWPYLFFGAAIALTLMIIADLPILRELARLRGLVFAACAVHMQAIHYTCCGFGLLLGAVSSIVVKRPRLATKQEYISRMAS